MTEKATKKTAAARKVETADKRNAERESGDYVPVSDLDKDLEAANEEVEDYLEQQAIKQGAYVEGVDESEINKEDNVEVDDHSAELSAQEVADEADPDKAERRKAKAKERTERREARTAKKAPSAASSKPADQR